MVIQVDNKEGALGISVRDFQDRYGKYKKSFQAYHYCDKEIKSQMIKLLEYALERIKYGPIVQEGRTLDLI